MIRGSFIFLWGLWRSFVHKSFKQILLLHFFQNLTLLFYLITMGEWEIGWFITYFLLMFNLWLILFFLSQCLVSLNEIQLFPHFISLEPLLIDSYFLFEYFEIFLFLIHLAFIVLLLFLLVIVNLTYDLAKNLALILRLVEFDPLWESLASSSLYKSG